MTTLAERLSLGISPLSSLERILDCDYRPTASDALDDNGLPKTIFGKQYLVKCKGISYLHCFWVPKKVLEKAYASNPLLKTLVDKFHQDQEAATNSGEDYVAIPPEFTTVDRILDSRGGDDGKEYLLKYKGLPDDELYWESESDISTFQKEIQTFEDINSGPRGDKSAEPETNPEEQYNNLRVLGFSQRERAIFYKTLMRFGIGDDDWSDFVHPLKQKTLAEIKAYGILFLKHISEDTDDTSLTYSDGVPKENVNSGEVRARITVLTLIKEKLKFIRENPTKPLFRNRVLSRLRPLRGGQFWKEEHDKILLHAIIKHGYPKWQRIANDLELGIQEVICKQRGIPYITGDTYTSPDGHQMDPKYVKDMKRRVVEFVRTRGQLLEEALSTEYTEESSVTRQIGSSSMQAQQVETVTNVMDTTSNQMPKLDPVDMFLVKSLETDRDAEMEDVVQKWPPDPSNFIDLTMTDEEE